MEYFIAKFHVKSELNKQFQKILLNDKISITQEAGNVEVKVFVDKNDLNSFIIYEVWRNEEALQYHIKQPYAQKYKREMNETLDEKPVFIRNPDIRNISFDSFEETL